MSSEETNNENSWGSWWEHTSKQAKSLASQAQEAAVGVTKKYELDKHANTLVKGIAEISTVASDTLKEVKNEAKKNAEKKEVDLSLLDFTYVTENVIAMAFPYDPDKRKIKGGNNINSVSHYLRDRHAGRYMIWNISEDTYDYSKFDDQVLEYKFPGHPAPPLGLMFKMCTSVESWTDADSRNIAVIHCLTGKGRTAVIVACVLTWIGEFSSPMEALQYTANRRNVPVESLTIPSQRRYIQYFSNVLDGVKPRAEPLLLRRIIMNGTPGYCPNPTWIDSDNSPNNECIQNENEALGCCPYMQLFKNGRLMASALATAPSDPTSNTTVKQDNKGTTIKPKDEVRWVSQNEGCISFQLDCLVQGDLLVRCRHFDDRTGARISMFRAAFHTGYVPSGVLRLTRAQLDGPNTDDRFDEDFFIDLIFAPVETSKVASAVESDSKEKNEQLPLPPAPSTSDSGVILDAQSTDKFEQMLHRDARFWENIADRKVRSKKRKPRKYASNATEKFSIVDGTDIVKQSRDEALRNSLLDTSQFNYIEDDDGDDEIDELLKLDGNDIKYYKQEDCPHGEGGMSDQELINQLAQAEIDDDGDDSSTQFVDVKEDIDSLVEGTSTSNELKALEELEKELGLDFNVVSASSCSDNEGKGNSGPKTRQAHDRKETTGEDSQSLDDLEDFLHSLNT